MSTIKPQIMEQVKLYRPGKDIEAKARRTNVPWVTQTYDDESLLLELRLAHPGLTWKDIRGMFNDRVPVKRKRSLWAVTTRGRAVRKARALADGPLAHTNPSTYTDTESRTIGGNMTILPPSPPMRHMEILSHSWDGDIDVEGVSTMIAMEREALETAKRLAMEAASGTFRCTNPFL